MNVYDRHTVEDTFGPGKWSGAEFLCKSPLRPDERTPSFRIDPEKRTYYDFGSGQGGKLSELFQLVGATDPYRKGERVGAKAPASLPAVTEADEIQRSKAQAIWNAASPADGHPYLMEKQTETYGTRRTACGAIWSSEEQRLKELRGDFLVVPAYRPDGLLAGIEQILPNGKKYALGAKGFFPLGELEPGRGLILAEGFATAASLKGISGFNVACAFGEANLEKAAIALREVFPGEILIAPDAGSPVKVDGVAVIPMPDGYEKNTDWNDISCTLGAEAAAKLFREEWSRAQAGPKEPAQKEEKPSLRSFRQKIEPIRGEKPEMIGGVFPRGGVSILAGQQGAGKSLLMQKFCSDLSLGGCILDGVSDYAASRKTVYFVGELPVNTMNDRQRTSAWAQEEENFILYSRIAFAKKEIPLDLNDGEGFKNVAEIAADEKPDLLVFDSLMSFLSCDESDMKSMQGAFTKLLRLADDLQCAVVVVHHIRKRKTMERASRLHMDDIIGSSIITRNASVAIGAEKLKTNDGEEAVYVSNLKSWYAPLDEFSFKILRDDYKVFRGLEIDLNPENPAANKGEAIENAVFKGHEDGSDFTVLAISKLTGATDRYVRKLFREWENSGRITSKGGGKNVSYSIMQKFRNGQNDQCSSASASGTAVPEGSGTDDITVLGSGTAVPERKSVIAMAEAPFRNKPMIVPEGNLTDIFPGGLTVDTSPSLAEIPSIEWLEVQPPEVKGKYAEELKRISIIGVDEPEDRALKIAWDFSKSISDVEGILF